MTKQLVFNTSLSSSNGNLRINLLQRGYSVYSHHATAAPLAEFDTDSTFDIYFFPGMMHEQPRLVPAFTTVCDEEERFLEKKAEQE